MAHPEEVKTHLVAVDNICGYAPKIFEWATRTLPKRDRFIIVHGNKAAPNMPKCTTYLSVSEQTSIIQLINYNRNPMKKIPAITDGDVAIFERLFIFACSHRLMLILFLTVMPFCAT